MSEKSLWQYLNDLARDRSDLLAAVDVILGLLISLGLFAVAWKANTIANSNLRLASEQEKDRAARLTHEERERIREVHAALSYAIDEIMLHHAIEQETMARIAAAWRIAQTEMPAQIRSLTDDVFKMANRARMLDYRININSDSKSEKYLKEYNELLEHIVDIDLSRTFRPFLEIKTPTP